MRDSHTYSAQGAPAASRGESVLAVEGLSCGYGGSEVLRGVTFSLRAGCSVVLLGPNGVGKTTLFKTILGFLPKLAGSVMLDGRDAHGISRRELARLAAYVPQSHDAAFGFTVREMVLMGRTPHLAGMASPGKADEAVADEVIESLALGRIATRDFITLSGGERQMVLIARALACRPRLLVMDEPCANLDLGNQSLLLHQIASLMRRDIAVVVTSHDPNHAFALGSDVVCLHRGGRVTCGSAESVLTGDFLGELYGVPVAVGRVGGSDAGAKACVPLVGDMRGKEAL